MKSKWDQWQKQVIHEEYVEPELDEASLKKRMEEVNKKYYAFRSDMKRVSKLKVTN
ncbi:hypothetical protein N0O92_14670 [Alkalihalobacillus sp. MEB130]|uniref:hypothetical protein n=1 Tax=Alkalihalobacillus sp. MEB130 TaxID=2976704 RepID=UPI0028DFC513|nr:hypothetical protein [Alkalihalobacillus sp. MEB130]MDT8861462.1 hypothetical protein [Alkalihalobacillus sp. MEB130]